MENFEQLQSIYDNQKKETSTIQSENILRSGKALVKKLKIDQIWSFSIMTPTLMILIAFLFWVGYYEDWKLNLGLGLMIGSLGVRVFLEIKSTFDLRTIQPHLATSQFLQKLKSYRQGRLQLQKWLTPIIYLIYGVGLILFLMAIKPAFSVPVFIYFVVSGLGFWIGFIWVIRSSYRKEREVLDQLRSIGGDGVE